MKFMFFRDLWEQQKPTDSHGVNWAGLPDEFFISGVFHDFLIFMIFVIFVCFEIIFG